jgi:hypothetical protein
MAEDEKQRNSVKIAVLKARYTGLTGEVIGAIYNQKTGRMSALSDADFVTSNESFKRVEVTDKETGEIVDAVINTKSGNITRDKYQALGSVASTWRPKAKEISE